MPKRSSTIRLRRNSGATLSDIIFERAKFNQRCQEEGKSADSFITSLYCLVEHCQYGALRDEMTKPGWTARCTSSRETTTRLKS